MVRHFVSVLVVCAVSSVGCVGASEPDEADVAAVGLPLGSFNSLGWDSLAVENGPAPYNRNYGASILEDPLRTSLTGNGLDYLPSGVKNAVINYGWSNELFKYIVECALPPWTVDNPGANKVIIDGAAGSPFHGKFGYYPAWETGACGTTCQEKISACLLAHANLDDVEEPIGVVSDWAPVEASYVYNDYPVPEGSYFGNVFLSNPVRNACFNGPISGTMKLLRLCHSCTTTDCTCRDETADTRIVLKGSGSGMIQGCNTTCSTYGEKIPGNVNSRYYDNCTVNGVTYTNVVTVRRH